MKLDSGLSSGKKGAKQNSRREQDARDGEQMFLSLPRLPNKAQPERDLLSPLFRSCFNEQIMKEPHLLVIKQRTGCCRSVWCSSSSQSDGSREADHAN